MKNVFRTLFACSLVIILVLALAPTGFAQEEMSMDEYNAQLQEWASREKAAMDEIQKLDTEIAALNSEISSTEQQIADVWAEIYSTIGVTEADVNSYRQQLQDLDRQLNALGTLSPEDLFKRRAELDEIEAKVNEMKESRIYALTEMRNMVASLEGKIAQLRAKMPKAMYDQYTVVRGDYLWRISKNQYGEPLQWMRIYSYNAEQIKDPDLIYPDWILKIHRDSGPGEYLVSPGDNLSKIAGSMDVMNDPTKWRALYEANKSFIGDEPSMIYPYSVLKIPR